MDAAFLLPRMLQWEEVVSAYAEAQGCPLDQYNSVGREEEERRRERTGGGHGEDGEASRSERQDLIKTKNINDENGVDPFRSQRWEHGKISPYILTYRRVCASATYAPIWWKRRGFDEVL